MYQGGATDALVSIRWDGTDQKEHLQVTGPTPAGATSPMDPDVIQIAPVGDQAMAVINGQI